MSTLTTTRAYRAYIWIGNVRYYANRPANSTTTRKLSWRTAAEEYPSHFTWYELKEIKEWYLDQNVKYEEIYLNAEEDA